jgi:branched-chain amino acid transport system permease protein
MSGLREQGETLVGRAAGLVPAAGAASACTAEERRVQRRELLAAFGGSVGLFVIVAAIALGYATLGGSQKNTAIVLLMNMVLVIGLQIFSGNSGVLSLAHVSFAGIAAYISAILSAPTLVKGTTIPDAPFGLAGVELPAPLAMIVAVVVTTLIAAVIGLAIARLSGISATIVTLALMLVVFAVLTNWKSLTGGAEAFYGIPVTTNIWWGLGAVFVALVVARLFKASRLGLRVQSTREDEVAASSSGVQVVRSRFWSWVLSSAVCAMAGVLIGHFLGAISPSGFYFTLLFLTLAMLVLGGEYGVTGAVVGTVLMTIVSEATRYLGDGPVIFGVDIPPLAGLSQLVQGAIIIVVMIWRPSGLLGDRELDGLLSRRLPRGARSAGGRVVAASMETAAAGGTATAEAVPEAAVGATASGEAGPETPTGPGTATAAAAPAAAALAADAAPAAAALSVRGASMHFAGLAALDDASLEVHSGQVVGLIGPNGAGKTTLLNVISGLYAPTAGEMTLNGVPLNGLRPYQIARLGIARTFQTTRLFRELTVRQNLEVAASVARGHRPHVARSAAEILSQFGFEEIADTKAGVLPYGVQREVEVARAVALGPGILLLDEPAAGLNDAESMELVSAVRGIRDREGCGILLIDHDLHFVMALCEYIYVLDAGRIICRGAPEEVQRDPLVVAAYLGTRGGESPAAAPTMPALGEA